MVQVRTPIRSNAGGCPKSGKRLFFFLFFSLAFVALSAVYGVLRTVYGVHTEYRVRSIA